MVKMEVNFVLMQYFSIYFSGGFFFDKKKPPNYIQIPAWGFKSVWRKFVRSSIEINIWKPKPDSVVQQ